MATSDPILKGTPTGSNNYTPYLGNNGGQTSIKDLTLAGGMTAGWGHSGETENPSLYGAYSGQSINPYGGIDHYPISRVGTLRNVMGSLGPDKQYILNFLYNPGEIDVSFAVDQAAMPANYLTTSYDPYGFNAVTVPLTGSQSVTWSLLFDRTYDMMYDPDPNGNRGVLKDVGALYLLMGTFTSDAAVPMSTLCEVVFGQTDNGNIWGFTGYIAGANITYPIFRHNMIPSRAQVSITMTTVYVSPTIPSGGTNSDGSGPPASTPDPASSSSGPPPSTVFPPSVLSAHTRPPR